MSDLFALPLHLILAFFISSLPFGGRDPLAHRRSPVDIPSVSAVASTLTGPRPTIYGMSGGRTSGLLLVCWTHSSEGSTNMPMLRLTQHSLARFMWVVPYSQPVSLAVKPQRQEIRRWREAQAQIPMGQPGRACVSTGLRRNIEPC